MKKISCKAVLIIWLLFFSLPNYAQKMDTFVSVDKYQNKNTFITANRSKNNIIVSLFGNVSFISYNYERLFFIRSQFFVACRLGFGHGQDISEPSTIYITIPHQITGNWGKGRHFFEFGLGGTTVINHNYWSYRILGYRIQSLGAKKINFSVFVNIPFSDSNRAKGATFIPLGISIGGSF